MTSSLDAVRWPAADKISIAEIAKAREELLNLIQWPARIGNSYVPGDPQARIELEFRPAGAAFFTKSFENGLSLTLRLPSLEMQFLHDGRPTPHVFDPNQRSPAEVEAWLLVELLHRGVDRDKFSRKLPYGMAGLMTGDAEDHMPSLCRDGLEYLTEWLQSAGHVLATLYKGKIVCSPQTLELTCGSQPGVGFALNGAGTAEPFFYTTFAADDASGARQQRASLPASVLLTKSDPTSAAIEFLKSSATGSASRHYPAT